MNLFILVFISLGTAIGSMFYIKSALVSLFKGGINNMLSGELPMLKGDGGDGKGKVKFLEKDFQTQDPYATMNNTADQTVNQTAAPLADMKPTTGSSSNDESTSGNDKLTLNLDKEKNIDFNENSGSLIIKQKDGRKVEIKGFNRLLEKKRYIKLPDAVNEDVEDVSEENKRRKILSEITLSDGKKLGNEAIERILEENESLIERNGFAQLFEGILLANPNLKLESKDDIAKAMKNVVEAFKLIDGNASLDREPRNPLGIPSGVGSAQEENGTLPSIPTLGSGTEDINESEDLETNGKPEETSKEDLESAITIIRNYSTVVGNSKSSSKTRTGNIQKTKDMMMKNAINLVVKEAKNNPEGLKMQFDDDTLAKIIEAIESYEKNKKKKKSRSKDDRYSNFLKDKLQVRDQGNSETSTSEGNEIGVGNIRTVDNAQRERAIADGSDDSDTVGNSGNGEAW